MLAFKLLVCYLVVFIFGGVVHSKSVKYEVNKFSEKILTQSNSINDTGLTFGTYYYLKDKTGLYIRWDGTKVNLSPKFYGLTSDSYNKSIDEWYLFVIEPSDNDVKIKNVKTGKYITLYVDYFILSDLIQEINQETRMRLVLRENNFINVETTYLDHQYYLSVISYSGTLPSDIKGLSAISIFSIEQEIAYISFTPTISLYAKINNFTYETLDSETVQNHLSQISLISPIYINNTSPTKITHEILTKKPIKESLDWKFDQNLEHFDDVSISKRLPTLITRSGGFENFVSNFELKPSSNKKSPNIVDGNEYILKKTVEIPPDSSVKIESFVNKIDDLKVKFTAVAEITGEDHSGDLSGQQILSTINGYQDANFTIIQVLKFSILVQVNGFLETSFVLNNKFIVMNFNSDNSYFD